MFFSWGNVVGHAKDSSYNFSQDAYAATTGSRVATNLSDETDAATINLGNGWRMPTVAELTELKDNCDTEYGTFYGVKGLLFTSRINGKKVFFPAAGYYASSSLSDENIGGYYWLSDYQNETLAKNFRFIPTGTFVDDSSPRRDGFVIRPVRYTSPNRSIVPPTPEDEPKEEETQTTEEPKDEDQR